VRSLAFLVRRFLRAHHVRVPEGERTSPPIVVLSLSGGQVFRPAWGERASGERALFHAFGIGPDGADA
jgi:hypothetical protein